MPATGGPLWRAYGLGMAICHEFLGLPWVERHIMSPRRLGGFISQSPERILQPEIMDAHLYRVVNLGEMLFNLQQAQGFDSCLAQLEAGQIEDTFAELETGKLLWLSRIPFRFIEPQQQRGMDYDIEVQLRDQQWVCADTKNKIESTAASANTVFNALNRGRRQLPENRPSFIFVRVPPSWIWPDIEVLAPAEDGVRRFLRGTERVASVKLHTQLTVFLSPEHAGQPLVCKEFDNERCRFTSRLGWALFGEPLDPREIRWRFLLQIAGYDLPLLAPLRINQ